MEDEKPREGQFSYESLESGQLKEGTLIPSTKIEPVVTSRFQQVENYFRYRYTIANGKAAKQKISHFYIDGIPDLLKGEIAPKYNEEGIGIKTEKEVDARLNSINGAMNAPYGWDNWLQRPTNSLSRISWTAAFVDKNLQPINDGLPAGSKATGFELISPDLPGVLPAKFKGNIDYEEIIPGEAPVPSEEMSDSSNEVENQWDADNFVVRSVAAPMIMIPLPFDSANLLERLNAHVNTWADLPVINDLNKLSSQHKISLIDPAFTSQLDRYFQSAISACRLNQPGTCKQQIETMRAMVKREQPNAGNGEGESADNSGDNRHKPAKAALIDPLAASVLDFDLQYVTKRMDEGDGEHASAGGPDSVNHSEHRHKK